MAVSYLASGSIGYGSTTATAGAPAGVLAGDLLVLTVGTKPDTATITTPAGWTLVNSTGGGGGTTGIDTGPTRTATFYMEATGAAASQAVSITSGNSSYAQMHALRNATGQWLVAGAGGSDSTTGTAWSATMGADPGITTGDFLLAASTIPTDIGAGNQFTGHNITATGLTVGTRTEISEPFTATGNDLGGFIFYALATAGTSTAAAVVTSTASGTTTNVRGTTSLVRARERPIVQAAAALSVSATLTAGGTATSGAATPYTAVFPFTGSSMAANGTPTGLTISNITAGPGGAINVETALGYASDPVLRCVPPSTASSEATAVSTGTYWEFTVTPDPGVTWSLADFTMNGARGGGNTDARGFAIYDSVNNYATARHSDPLAPARPTWEDVSATLGHTGLTGPVTIRAYYWGQGGTNQSVECDDVTITGTVGSGGTPPPTGGTPQVLQSASAAQPSASGPKGVTATLPQAPTVGNLLVAALTVDKDSGTITTPTGWTMAGTYVETSSSGALAWRVADGTANDGCTWTWASAEVMSAAAIIETNLRTPTAAQTFVSAVSSATSLAESGDAGTATAVGMAVAVVGVDTAPSWATNPTWDGGYTKVLDETGAGGAAGRPGLSLAVKALANGDPTATTATATGTADQMHMLLTRFAGTPAAPPTGTTVQLTAVADATVALATPSTNLGTAASLDVDADTGGSPTERAYVRWNLTSIPSNATITAASIRLVATASASVDAQTILDVPDNTWGETTITWSNRPATGATLGTIGPPTPVGTAHTATIPAAHVQTALAAGALSVQLEQTGTDGAGYSSREGTDPPRLDVTYTIPSTVTRQGTAPLSVTVTLAPANAVRVAPAAAPLSVAATLTAGGVTDRPAAAALTAGPSLTAGPVRTVPAAAPLSVSAALTATGASVATVPAAAALSIATALTGAATRTRPAAATLTAAAALTVTPAATRPATAALTVRAVLTGTVTVTGAGQYPPSGETIPNPERGWFIYTETHYQANGTGHVALDQGALIAARTGTTTLATGDYAARTVVFRYYVIEKYLGQDTIDQAYLDLIAADLNTARAAGVKVVPRFAYSTSGNMTAPYGADPPVARVLAHVYQLAPVLNAHADVLHAIQAGFIGMWGEWYYTDNFGDQGTLTAQNWNDRRAVLDALLDHLDDRIYVLVRYPGVKARYFA